MDEDSPNYKKVPLPPDGQPKLLQMLGKIAPGLASGLTRLYQALGKAAGQTGKASQAFAKSFSKEFVRSLRWSLKKLGWLLALPVYGFAKLMRWNTKQRYKSREKQADAAVSRGPRFRRRHPFWAFVTLAWIRRPLGRLMGRLWAKWWIRIPATAILFLFTVGLTFGGILSGICYFRAQSFEMAEVSDLESGCAVLDRNGTEIGRVFVKNRQEIAVSQLPGHFLDALIATEDERFFEHGGNDFKGIFRATWANIRSMRVEQGASTITQQLARDVYDLKSRSLLRKLTEIFVARRIEEAYTKEEILQHYVNRIYMGSGCWGMAAASIKYFGKEVEELDIQESALLCGIIKRPSAYSPFTNPNAARSTRNYTLGRMVSMGYLEPEMGEKLKQTPLSILPPETREDPPHYLLAQIRQEAQELLEARNLPLEGFRIHTTVDTWLQDSAAKSIQKVLREVEAAPDYPHLTYDEHQASGKGLMEGSPDYLQAAVVILHNATGKVVAAVGGRDFDHSQFNRVFQARRPAGTAFLPLVYAAAFDTEKVTPLTPVLDAPMNNRKVMIGGENGVLGEWGVERIDNRYEGEVTAAYGLLRSKNGTTVRIGSQAGLLAVQDLAEKAGIESPLRDFPSTFLGSSEVTPLELARAYTLFPNRGWAPRKPTLVAQITQEDGTAVYSQAVELRVAVLNEVTAGQITGILQASLLSDPLRDVCEADNLSGQFEAGKSGTAYEYTDAWAVGYNADYTCAVWVGFDQPKMIFDQAFGHKLAFPIWTKIMANLASRKPLPATPQGYPCTICMASGGKATPECKDQHGQLYWSLPFTQNIHPELPRCHLHGSTLVATPLSPSVGVTPIASKSPLLVGKDPYRSGQEAEEDPPVDP